jgi:hypothetical protein
MTATSEKTKIVAIERQWVKIPAFVNWIAQDANGAWWGYEAEPLQQEHGWYENEVGRCKNLLTTHANTHWQETLHRVSGSPVT